MAMFEPLFYLVPVSTENFLFYSHVTVDLYLAAILDNQFTCAC
jgi:hypothetical protein